MVLEIVLGLLGLLIALAVAVASIKVAREYERLVLFRWGRFRGLRGPGIFAIVPGMDRTVLVDLRTIAADVPKQRIVTKDNISVEVDAVVYWKVIDPAKAVLQVQDYFGATNLLGQTTLRDVIGQVELDHLLGHRDELNHRIEALLDTATDPWGIKVSAVTLRDVSLPEGMVRAIAKQAEAERERRSRVIMAEGEYQSAQRMVEAAALYEGSPAAMRLRELQNLEEIGRERNLVIVTSGHVPAEAADTVAIARATIKKPAA
jgi:regulator of protease activity HflC (stomatin/prohibitin superfamily)